MLPGQAGFFRHPVHPVRACHIDQSGQDNRRIALGQADFEICAQFPVPSVSSRTIFVNLPVHDMLSKTELNASFFHVSPRQTYRRLSRHSLDAGNKTSPSQDAVLNAKAWSAETRSGDSIIRLRAADRKQMLKSSCDLRPQIDSECKPHKGFAQVSLRLVERKIYATHYDRICITMKPDARSKRCLLLSGCIGMVRRLVGLGYPILQLSCGLFGTTQKLIPIELCVMP